MPKAPDAGPAVPRISSAKVGIITGAVALFPTMTVPFVALNVLAINTDLGQRLYFMAIVGGVVWALLTRSREEKRRNWEASQAKKEAEGKAILAETRHRESTETAERRHKETMDTATKTIQLLNTLIGYKGQEAALDAEGAPKDDPRREIVQEAIATTMTGLVMVTKDSPFQFWPPRRADGVLLWQGEELPFDKTANTEPPDDDTKK